MNHPATTLMTTKKTWGRVGLCSLWLCGSAAFAAPENWPKTYNAGVAAYGTNDFTAAAQAFERSLPATDRGLQAKAFFNLGNTTYRLGQAQPTQAHELWKRAVQHYEQALVLDPNDADAKFNHEFVKKKLEELEKQQQQQQQQQQNQNQDQKDNNKQDQSKQEQSKQDQPQNPQPQDSSKQDQQQPKEQSQQQPQQAEDQQQQNQERPQQVTQAQPSTEPFDKQQARALLDKMREDERLWDFHPELQMKNLPDGGEPAKDW